jgi:hypothetical protein
VPAPRTDLPFDDEVGVGASNGDRGEPDTGEHSPQLHESIRFAHNSERQFAKLLDFYGIAWDYEPTEFTLEWNRDGEPTQAFRPDFYLPAYDLYIEITTLNQKLVTKKNRKVRRLRELHPHINIKILYQRDYLNLLVKFGLEPPSQLVDDGDPVGGLAGLALDGGPVDVGPPDDGEAPLST